MDRTLLIQSNTAIKVAGRREHIKTCLSIVTLIGFIDISVSKQQDLRPGRIPLDLNPVGFEEVLLT